MLRHVSEVTLLKMTSDQQSEKGLAVRNAEGKAHLERDVATQHILSIRNATLQNVSPCRILYVQINSQLTYTPLEKTQLFPPNETKLHSSNLSFM